MPLRFIASYHSTPTLTAQASVPAQSRPGHPLNLPEELFAPVVIAPDVIAPVVIAAPGNRRVRQRIPCYCGKIHAVNAGHGFLCSGVAAGAALNIQFFCEMQPSSAIPQQSLGSMFHQICARCNAGQFLGETINCCARGSVFVPLIVVPDDLHSAICSPPVANHIRAYNMALSMASTGHQNLSPSFGAFVLGGKTYHRFASQLVDPSQAPGFAQIFMLDTADATARRLEVFGARSRLPALDSAVLAHLHELLLLHNPWVQDYRSAGLNPGPEVQWHSCGQTDITGMGLGAMLEGFGARSIVLQHQCGGITSIDDGHALYHPLAYVLLFPSGAIGWHDRMSRMNELQESTGRLSLTSWARFLMMRRVGGLTHLQSCGALTSEFWCDVWAQVESRKLGFLRRADMQSRIRSDRFCALDDAIIRRAHLGEMGTPVWMPASFVGSAKW